MGRIQFAEFSPFSWDIFLKSHGFYTVHNKQIGSLEVCRLEKKPELEKGLFLEEEKSLIGAIVESISRIVEREWAEAEIRKCRKKSVQFFYWGYKSR